MRIAIDIDGCLSEFTRPSVELLRSLGTDVTPLPPDGPYQWDYWASVGASPVDVHRMWEFISRTPRWWFQLPPHPDFRHEARERLWDVVESHEVTFITNRPSGSRQATLDWLKFYLPGQHPQVIIVPKRHAKADILHALDIEAVIEDNLDTLRACKDVELRILVDRPWNRGNRDGLLVAPDTLSALSHFDMESTDASLPDRRYARQ